MGWWLMLGGTISDLMILEVVPKYIRTRGHFVLLISGFRKTGLETDF